MPTGYTAPVVDGKITKFSDFALSCARAFGALISMRDDAMDAPIPKEIKPSDYHAKRVKEISAALAKTLKMTPAQMSAGAAKANEQVAESIRSCRREYELENSRLEKMLAEARAWEPPTPDHKGMKEFMVQQLTDSMHTFKYLDEPAKLSGQDWHKMEIDRLKRDLDYHTEENEQEIARAAERTEWLKQLRSSLR